MQGRWANGLIAGRRMAVGIDVNRRGVRVAVSSGGRASWMRQCARGARRDGRVALRIEALDAEPLPPGIFDPAGDADWGAVGQALSAVIGRVSRAVPGRVLKGVMALPDARFAMAPLDAGAGVFDVSGRFARCARRAPIFSAHACRGLRDASPAGVERLAFSTGPERAADARIVSESAVLAAAERVAGIARDALAVDWGVSGGDAPEIVFAAAAQSQIDARIDAAAAAGIELTAIDGEPHAVLRAIRHAACVESADGEPYLAIWIGDAMAHGWLIDGGAMTARARYPSSEHDSLAAMLRALSAAGAPRSAFVAGDLEWRGEHVSIADIGDLLGCIALPFECAGFCARDGCAGGGWHSAGGPDASRRADSIEELDGDVFGDSCDGGQGACRQDGDRSGPDRDLLLRSPGFALAFGLAMRGVLE